MSSTAALHNQVPNIICFKHLLVNKGRKNREIFFPKVSNKGWLQIHVCLSYWQICWEKYGQPLSVHILIYDSVSSTFLKIFLLSATSEESNLTLLHQLKCCLDMLFYWSSKKLTQSQLTGRICRDGGLTGRPTHVQKHISYNELNVWSTKPGELSSTTHQLHSSNDEFI